MQRTIIFIAIVLSMTPRNGLTQEADMASLIAETQPEIQEQINRVYKFVLIAGHDDLNENQALEAFEELERLKNITDQKAEIVKQLAIFVATTKSEEDLHSIAAGDMLERLRLPASISIRVLAPYLDAENDKLRDFAYGWFHNHDSHQRTHGWPPLGSVNYYDYAIYVSNRLTKDEKIPVGFINYIYEKHPGKALLAFAYATQHGDIGARLRAIHKRHKCDSHEEKPLERDETHQHEEEGRHAGAMQRRDLELTERIVSHAIWLNKNGFAERFQAALPEANDALATLAVHGEWWARLYVVYIMRQHPQLRQPDIVKQLSEDSDELVRSAGKSVMR